MVVELNETAQVLEHVLEYYVPYVPYVRRARMRGTAAAAAAAAAATTTEPINERQSWRLSSADRRANQPTSGCPAYMTSYYKT